MDLRSVVILLSILCTIFGLRVLCMSMTYGLDGAAAVQQPMPSVGEYQWDCLTAACDWSNYSSVSTDAMQLPPLPTEVTISFSNHIGSYCMSSNQLEFPIICCIFDCFISSGCQQVQLLGLLPDTKLVLTAKLRRTAIC